MSIDNNIDFKDHIVQYPNRFKQTTVAPGIVELVPTWIETPSQIIQPGTPVDSELFEKLKQNVTIYQQTFTTTNNQTVINLDRDFLVGQNRVSLSIGGVRQYAGQDYTETDSHTLTMTTPQKGGLKAEVIMFTASQAIAEDFFEQTVAAIAATQAANDAANDANVAAELARSASLNWRIPVDTFSQLSSVSNPQSRDTVMVRDTGKVYRYNGTSWLEIQDINPTVINEVDTRLSAQFVETKKEVKAVTLKPLFVETFVDFGRLGTGTPTGIASYIGGNYVCDITGNVGESFVTITNGNIADGGGIWLAVIRNDDLSCDINKVIGIDGNRFTLLEPLKQNISNGKIGNVHDAPQGLHYTELGYFAFAQKIYSTAPRTAQRKKKLSQFLGKSTTLDFWKLTTSFSALNSSSNIDNPTNKTLKRFGTPALVLNLASPSHSAELEIPNAKKGYLEIYISSENNCTLDFLKEGNVVKSVQITNILHRVILEVDTTDNIKVKVYDVTASGTNVNQLFIGNTTYFLNEFAPDEIINKDSKIVYIGDSWGTYHNKATTRELLRLMQAGGGKGQVLNYSRAGHTSNYALEGFSEYVLKNKPDAVVIEYFCNDFATISGTNLGTFTAVDGSQKNMNVTSIGQYVANIEKMIAMAIDNGIQPIIIMPSVTDSVSRTQDFSNKASSIWLGESEKLDTIDLPEIKARKLIQNGSTTYGNAFEILTTEENAGARVGFKTNTDKAITGGYLEGTYNNGVRKGGVMHDGRLVYPSLQTSPEYGTRTPNATNRGLIYSFDGQPDNADDQLRVVIRKSDGTYVTKKIQLID